VAVVFVAWDGDFIGKLIGQARLHDDPDALRKVASSIDRGNQLFNNWAVNHGGTAISAGGDEGIVSVPATALADLQDIKSKYEDALTVTVSIGVGMRMSQAFTALLASKLRGKNRVTMYDKDVQDEVNEASKSEDTEKQKLAKEYLSKAQTITHTGDGGKPSSYQVQEQSANPEIQQQQDLEGFKHQVPEDINNFEAEFHKIAAESEKKDQAFKASKSTDLKALKQKVAQSLQAIHQQLPQLAEIKQAAPETYAAVIGVVQGLIAMGRQLQQNDQQLAKAIGVKRKAWTGGGATIPAYGTPERAKWENNYKQAVANYFTEGQAHKLKLVKFPIDKVDRSHAVFGNEAKTRLYHRMVVGGDRLPPSYGAVRNGRLRIVDGNRRLDVALANKLPHIEAYVQKSEVNVTHNDSLPPAGMTATSTGGFENYDLGMDKADLMPGGLADNLRPENFDQEQLAIGEQHELEHTNDPQLACEIAMDHLAEDPDYYKQDEDLDKEPLQKMALIHNDPNKPMTVYRVQNANGEGPYNPTDRHDVPMNTPKGSSPLPEDDFSANDWGIQTGEHRFGFEKPEHAKKWFGEDILNRLGTRGFALEPVKARRVYRSKSGRQVFFLPHESETKLQMAKSDWPMSEDKEELDPSQPVKESKVLDKGVMPEHIASMKAKHKLVPGEILDSRHLVGVSPSGKNVVREVSAGMQRDLSETSNTTGPGEGQPTSARNRPSRT
jgi:hypothetical protein